MQIPSIKLNSGYEMPLFGLGTWKSETKSVGEAVKFALLEGGYNHVDCAHIYGNEAEIGEAFTEVFKTRKREDIFITSKLWNTDHDPKRVEEALKITLKNLKLDYLDLYLMHWGIAFKPGKNQEPITKDGRVQTADIPILDTWREMEKLTEKGLVRSIGVANFTTILMHDLYRGSKVKPAVNQIELHPYNSQVQLIDYMNYLGVAVTAYSPLGTPGTADPESPRLLEDPVIKKIADSYSKTPAQILIRWAVERNTIVIPKSTSPERIKENFDIWDFKLSVADMESIAALNRDYRYVTAKWWGIPYFK